MNDGIEDDALFDLFMQELDAHAGTISTSLLQLETGAAVGESLEALMRAAHSIKGAARVVGIDSLVDLAHTAEECFIAAQRGELSLTPADIDLLLRCADVFAEVARVTDQAVATTRLGSSTPQLVAALEALARGRHAPDPEVRAGLEAATSEAPVVPPPTPRPLSPQTQMPEPVQVPPAVQPTGSSTAPADERPADPGETRVLRVAAEDLSGLLGLAGDLLVGAESVIPLADGLGRVARHHRVATASLAASVRLLARHARGETTTQLLTQLDDLTRASDDLQTLYTRFEAHTERAVDASKRLYREVLACRMCPFADGLVGLDRFARDLARSLGKQAVLEIRGKNTRIDRDVLQRIEAPLHHLLRNAIDHGLESPDERVARGKPAMGRIVVDARHSNGSLLVTVADDGRGIDFDRLRAAVAERSLTTSELAATLTEAELTEFIFLPGFTTRTEVTEISGRGVGLDAVRRAVQAVHGEVSARATPGQGLRFELQLPVTLSVVRSLLVGIGGETYALPLSRLNGTTLIETNQMLDVDGRSSALVKGHCLELVDGARLLGAATSQLHRNDLRVVMLGGRASRVGLVVDQFLGERKLVVQPLPALLGRVPGVTCSALLDDGSPVLMLDVDDLTRTYDAAPTPEPIAHAETEASTGGAKRRSVLVVDDSITVREVERQILLAQGFDVEVASDGAAAWNTLQQATFDLVVTDIDMPRMDGIQLTANIRGHARTRDLPVVIVSYKDRDQDRARGLQVGANAYLTKASFHDDSFLATVRALSGGG